MPNTIKGRFIQKHDTETNWLKATNFIPLEGELIIYDADATYTYPRFKVGDGVTLVNDLPFSAKNPDWDEIDETSPSYIQNKTHWSKIINLEYTNDALAFEYIPLDDSRTIYGAFAETSVFRLLSENDVVTITFDGNTYTYTVPTGSTEGFVAGNMTIFNSSETDTGEPFVLSFFFSQGVEIYTLETDTTHSITISSTIENLHQLDAKYLPNDDTAPYPLKTNVYTKDEVHSEINASKEVETAIYGTTTFAQLTEWINAGKIVQVIKDGYIYRATRKTDSYIDFEQITRDLTRLKYLYCSSENKWWGTSLTLVDTNTSQTITGDKIFKNTLALKSDGDYKFYLCVGDDGSLSTSTDLNNFRRHVMVSDIVDNLTTNISTKPLSAAQGVVLKTQNDKKINLPETDGTVNYGTAGQFAVSDGAGGITWQTINNGDEVNY